MIAWICIQASPRALVILCSTRLVLFTSGKTGCKSIVVPKMTDAITKAKPALRSIEWIRSSITSAIRGLLPSRGTRPARLSPVYGVAVAAGGGVLGASHADGGGNA